MNETKRKVEICLQTAWNGERQTLRAKGHVYLKGRHTYIRYDEDEPGTGPKGVTTTVKAADGELTVLRHGAVKSEQRFVPGKATTGYYETPQGAFRLETTTKSLKLSLDEGIGFIEWSYKLLVGGADAGHFRLRLAVREDES